MQVIPGTSHRRTGLGAPRRIRVLRYHRIVDGKSRYPAHWPCVPVERFRDHLDLLAHWGYTPITFHDYRLFLKEELNLPKKPVVLTFDLAYKDNHKYMFPAMQKIGLKGVVFAAGDRHVTDSTGLEGEGLPAAPLMDDHDLIELHEAGFEIGSHGMTYSNLALLTMERAAEEISRSRILLEILINAPVLTFAYPFGAATPETKSLVSDAGYSIGCVMDAGPRTFESEPFNVRRISVNDQINNLMLHAKILFA